MNEIREKRTNFFNNNTHYVLFSGTPKNGNGPIRHLNDLFIILYLINKNSIPRENVFLSIDTQILEDLDEVTSNKKFKYFESANKTFKEVIKELERANSKLATYEASSLFDNAIEINGVKVIIKAFEGKEADSLREIVDKAKAKLKSCVVVLGTNNDKAIFAVGVTGDLTSKVKAGDLVKELAKITGGNGGGRPDFAQAGGKEGKLVPEALEMAKKILSEKL